MTSQPSQSKNIIIRPDSPDNARENPKTVTIQNHSFKDKAQTMDYEDNKTDIRAKYLINRKMSQQPKMSSPSNKMRPSFMLKLVMESGKLDTDRSCLQDGTFYAKRLTTQPLLTPNTHLNDNDQPNNNLQMYKTDSRVDSQNKEAQFKNKVKNQQITSTEMDT